LIFLSEFPNSLKMFETSLMMITVTLILIRKINKLRAILRLKNLS
jgi:hypothetical protein